MTSCEAIDMTEMIEEDTFHVEDTLNITECVREGMPCEDLCLQECVSYNRRVFNGWMKQPSACCAAASVAGAFNSLSCRRRGDEGVLNHSSVLQIYEIIFSELISKQKLDLERRLGSTIDALLALLEVELLKLGRMIGGVKVATATKASVINCIKRICRDRLISHPNLNSRAIMKEEDILAVPSIPTESVARDAVDCFLELFELEGISLLPEIPTTDAVSSEDAEDPVNVNAQEGLNDQEEDENEEEVEEDDGTNGILRIAPGKIRPGKRGSKKDSQFWDWRRDFFKLVNNIAGLRKLTAERPSTAAIGNWGVLQAVERLSEWTSLGTHLQARLFMGKKISKLAKLDVPLSRKDDVKAVTAQWDNLRAAFNHPHTVLLFHLKNHYALVFSLREWTTATPHPSPVAGLVSANASASATTASTDDTPAQEAEVEGVARVGCVRRQILTARKGQRPTAWMDFDEVRETMLLWAGYKMIAITYTGGDFPSEALKNSRFKVPEECEEILQRDKSGSSPLEAVTATTL